MFLCFIIQDRWDFVILFDLDGDDIVVNDETLPDPNNLLEESLGVDKLSGSLEKLSHVEITLAKVDALWTVLHALLIDTICKLLASLFKAIWTVLRHKETTECNLKRCSVSV